MKIAYTILLPICVLVLLVSTYGSVQAHEDIYRQIARIDQLLLVDSTNTNLYLKRGQLYLAHSEWSEGLNDFKKCLNLDPNMNLANYFVAKALYEGAQYERAVEYSTKYLQKEPTSPNAYLLHARILIQVDKVIQAIAAYSSGIAINQKGKPVLYLERAEALVNMGNHEEAISGLNEGILALGSLMSLEQKVIAIELKLNNYSSALNHLQVLASKQTRKEMFLNQEGDILALAGRKTDAISAYNNCIKTIEYLRSSKQNTPQIIALKKDTQQKLKMLQDEK